MMLRFQLLGLLICSGIACASAERADPDDLILENSKRITQEVLTQGRPYQNLKELVQIGHRLSGSTGASQAVDWAEKKLNTYGLDRVWRQPVQVPHWVRGAKEKATLTYQSETISLKVAALGNSVGTGPL